jgi:hypothetical protein
MTMADDPTYPRELSPNEVAARVGEILSAAEHDAREIIDAARRGVPAVEPPPVASEPSAIVSEPAAAPKRSNGASSMAAEEQPSLDRVVNAIDALATRLDRLERTVESRLDLFAGLLASERARTARPTREADDVPPPGGGGGEAERESESVSVSDGRVERVRAVELALRGFTREQIAAELRFTLPLQDIEALLNEVLEGH